MYIVSNNAIAQQEAIGRQIFNLQHPGNQWIENTDKFGGWDLSGSTRANGSVPPTDKYIEVKLREIRSITYSTSFLEVKKYEQLMALANQTCTGKAFYFVAYTDNVAFLFDFQKIKNIQQYYDRRWMKEVSLEGQTKVVEKEIYDLPLSSAVKKYKW